MAQNYMIRELRDDHVRDHMDRYRPLYVKNLIGVLCFPGALPQVVACGTLEYSGHLCLNEVFTDADGTMHLSVFATVTLNPAQLEQLKREGKLIVTTAVDEPTVTLLHETLKPHVAKRR